MECEIPGYFIAAPARRNFAGAKSNSRELGDIEEVPALDMPVALRIAGVQAVGIDGSLNARLIRLGLVEIDRAGNRIELSSHIGDHHVPHFETRGAMLRVDLLG